MSLTSYRAAPSRVNHIKVSASLPEFNLTKRKGRLRGPKSRLAGHIEKRRFFTCALQTWQRLTLPRLETKYHQRWSVSRPSSEWDRVQPLRHNHQVGETHE